MLAHASRCLHAWYLECYGDPSEKTPPDAGTRLLWERGLEHERKMVAKLEDVVEPSWDERDWKEGLAATTELMRKGHPWIYQGVLLSGSMRGKPDLLRRVEGKSALGDYTYIPVDIKNHKSINKKDRIQLQAYSLLLEPVLGSLPDRGAIWLNTGEIQDTDFSKDLKEFEQIISDMDKIRRRDFETHGLRCSECKTCPWIDHCEKNWHQSRNICLVRGVDITSAKKLIDIGIESYDQLADIAPDYLCSTFGWSEKKVRNIIYHAKARAYDKRFLKRPVKFPEGLPIYFYDIETFGECTYLHGIIRMYGNQRDERSFIARDSSEEGDAWHEFLKYLSQDMDAVIYCWADYERRFIYSLWDSYGGDKDGWELLSENLEDQCKFVRDNFILPVTTYSIKEVAPTFGFRWDAEDAGGLNSEMWYKNWLETGDKEILNKIIQYNLDDVKAMEVIHNELTRQLKIEGEIIILDDY